MMNRFGFVIFVVCMLQHTGAFSVCAPPVAMYAASALPPEAVPEQHTQGWEGGQHADTPPQQQPPVPLRVWACVFEPP